VYVMSVLSSSICPPSPVARDMSWSMYSFQVSLPDLYRFEASRKGRDIFAGQCGQARLTLGRKDGDESGVSQNRESDGGWKVNAELSKTVS
jgi:hypothetical protein